MKKFQKIHKKIARVTTVNCSSKLAKLFNLLNSIGVSAGSCDEDVVVLTGLGYTLHWFNNNYIPSFYDTTICFPDKGTIPYGWSVTDVNTVQADWIVIDGVGRFNKYKDSDFAVDTSKYSYEELVEIVLGIVDYKGEVNLNQLSVFTVKHTEVQKVVDFFGTTETWNDVKQMFTKKVGDNPKYKVKHKKRFDV